MALIAIRNLSFSYPGAKTAALSDITLEIEAGEFLTIAGASGSGKSTLLRQLKTALVPHGTRTGEILIGGRPLESLSLREQTENIGYVLQDPEAQIVTDQVWHELAFGLESLGCEAAFIRRRVAEMVSFFGMEAWFHRDVRELSGGQRQLLNLAAVMVMQPSLLVLDEPTAQLDPIAARDFLETVSRIHRELGTTVVMTEHRLEDVLPMSDRLVILESGQVVCNDTPAAAGEALKALGHEMFLSMPTPMRVYAALPSSGGTCPITVRDGRRWLVEYEKNHGLGTVPIREAPVHGAEPILELRDIWFRYEKETPDVLLGLSLRAYAGEILALMGGNGAGKSTLLGVAAGFLRPYRGSVRVMGKPLAQHSALYTGLLGMLPQDPSALFVKKTVREDLLDAQLEESNVSIDEVAKKCRIASLLDRHPGDLSGGERQRAALAKVLLRALRILLLDEPTKGVDAAMKLQFAEILEELAADGVLILMVSHDVEFCAQTAHRCAMVFDGTISSEGDTRTFFCGNGFYTTAANRMARALLPDAVTAADIIAACGVEAKAAAPKREPLKSTIEIQPQPNINEEKTPVKKPAGRHIWLPVLAALLLIPFTIWCGMYFLKDRQYYLISLLVILETMVPFFLTFERRRPQARELVLLAVLCAAAASGRALFSVVPLNGFSPAMAIVILTGTALGCESGFLTGAITMFVSNFFLGQGPWTPWQMFAMGLIGFLSGLCFGKLNGKTVRTWMLMLFGVLAAMILYGGLMNPASVLFMYQEVTWELILASYVTGFAPDLSHAAATALFLFLLKKPFLEILDRMKRKYGWMQ